MIMIMIITDVGMLDYNPTVITVPNISNNGHDRASLEMDIQSHALNMPLRSCNLQCKPKLFNRLIKLISRTSPRIVS